MRRTLASLTFILALCLSFSLSIAKELSLSDGELARIGALIYKNEAGGKPANLTAWNEGEEFASLGIGHFLWYPAGEEYRFVETFPALIEYMKSENASIPKWLSNIRPFDLPWKSRSEFYSEFDSPRMVSLREFLLGTFALQTSFIADRLEKSLPAMLNAAPPGLRGNIERQFYRVAESGMGMYALIDYVNFKGEGVSESERYKGQGWGLLQVLANMKGTEPGPPALAEFARSAEFVLERRVRNSPPERNEKRWLPGWRNRINTYTDETLY